MDAGIGPAPTVRGTSLYSPDTDVTLSKNMALAWQIGIEGAVPLWTFGKLSSLWAAADAQVRVGEHEVKKARNDVRLSVHKAFYGLQLARDALALMRDASRQMERYAARLARLVAKGDGDDIELLKMRMYAADLEAKQSEVRQEERAGLGALRFLTGVKELDIPADPLVKVEHTLAPVATYLSAARLFRPEINMARAGVLARRAQVELEQSRLYPDIALGLSAKWARAPEVTDQTNPFVRDGGNYLYYGTALAFRWKLDFLPKAARIARAQAELQAMRATERFALGGVGLEVEKAHGEALEAERRLDALTRAAQYARRWLIKVQQGIEVGTMDDEDIVDPAKEYAFKRLARMKATYEYNLAVAQLHLATGWSPSTLDR
jgi:outer membrane protein TolC